MYSPHSKSTKVAKKLFEKQMIYLTLNLKTFRYLKYKKKLQKWKFHLKMIKWMNVKVSTKTSCLNNNTVTYLWKQNVYKQRIPWDEKGKDRFTLIKSLINERVWRGVSGIKDL